MKLLSIDPGPETSGVVLLDVDVFPPRVVSQIADIALFDLVHQMSLIEQGAHVAAERVAPYGMKVGAETFETCEVWGSIRQACAGRSIPFTGIYRREVKLALGLPTSSGDAQVNAAIRALYPATGGGKTPQVGIKSKPGPLYGMSGHCWAALGIGIAWCLERERLRRKQDLADLVDRVSS